MIICVFRGNTKCRKNYLFRINFIWSTFEFAVLQAIMYKQAKIIIVKGQKNKVSKSTKFFTLSQLPTGPLTNPSLYCQF